MKLPKNWPETIDRWTAERGLDWRRTLDAWVARPRRGTVMTWTPERYYEIIYLWEEERWTAEQINRWWISTGIINGANHLGVVDGPVFRMQKAGLISRRRIMDSTPLFESLRPLPPRNRTREILELRRQRVEQSGGAFDSRSREERGLPAVEIASQQHPAYPVGITYDAAHRIEHGRTTIFSVADRKRQTTVRQVSDLCELVSRAVGLATPPGNFGDLSVSQCDLLRLRLSRAVPEARQLVTLLENLYTVVNVAGAAAASADQ